jgi:glutathione S-transferase
MLRILGKASSINVRKVLWTCEEIGLSYSREDWGSGFASTHTPEFLALNPNAQVPVIEDENGILWESNTICRYLATRSGRQDLLPPEGIARARVEQWMDWQLGDLNNAWRYPVSALVRRNPDYADSVQIAAGVRGWNALMTILDGQLARTGAFVTGETFTLADIVIGLSLNRWLMTPMERPELAAARAYYERLSERPGFLMHGRNGIA